MRHSASIRKMTATSLGRSLFSIHEAFWDIRASFSFSFAVRMGARCLVLSLMGYRYSVLGAGPGAANSFHSALLCLFEL